MNTPALAPVLPPAMPGPAPASANPSGDPGAFARELQSASQPKAPAAGADDADPADKARSESSDDTPEAAARPEGETSGAATNPASQARANAQRTSLERWLAMARAGTAERGATADAEGATDARATDAERALAAPGAGDDEATAPEAAALLAALLPRPAEDVAATAARGTAGDDRAPSARATDEEAGVDLGPLAGTSVAKAPATARARDDAAATLTAVRSEPEAAEAAGGRGRLTGAARDEAAGAASPTAALTNAAAPLPPFAGELARAGQAAAAAGSHAASPAPAELHLPTPVSAPGFVPRLSGELAVLARDGVQEARVQVNPLELGPIAVQITLDGTAAQVRLAVDSAQTRELLEQGMPSLAAALRENGLTLTGGGVFQQPRGHGRDGQGADTPSARGGDVGRDGDAEPVAAATAPRRVRHPGQVDVFA